MKEKSRLKRFTESTGDRDRSDLRQFCVEQGFVPIANIVSRKMVRTGGEIGSAIMVPLAGAPSLEAVISDGTASITAVFFGRGRIAGLTSGRRLAVEGMPVKRGNRTLLFNPIYYLLP